MKDCSTSPFMDWQPLANSLKSVVHILKHNSARVHMIGLTLLLCIRYVLSSYPDQDTEILRDFPQSLQANAEKIYEIDHDHLFPHPF